MIFDTFFTSAPPLNAETGVYQESLVVLSYIVASFASYATLSLIQQMVGAKIASEKRLLHWGGAFAMGAGVWSMHFIGMLAYKMRMAITYDPELTLLSLLIAVAVAYSALRIVAVTDRLSLPKLLTGAVLLGLGICGMHYTGMAAMRMDADLYYIPSIFFLSIAIAIGASAAALLIFFKLARYNNKHQYLLQTSAALVLGAAISGMHYTGMAAAVFVPYANCRYDPGQNSDALAIAIAGITSMIIGLAMATVVHRKLQAEIRLKSSESLLAAIVESSDDSIVSISLDGGITSWNAAAERIFGYTATEVVGKNISLIVPPDRSGEEKEILSQLKTGKRIDHLETVRVTKEGRLIDALLTVSPIRDASGTIIGASKITHDISDRKKAEEQLRNYTRQLERSNQELDDFAYIASHDLKEPLRGMTIQANFLMEDLGDKLGPEGARRISRIIEISHRMDRLINELLYFSRLGRTELAVQDTDLNLVVEEIRQLMQPLLKERGVRIKISGQLPHIVCDRPRVAEVFRNLITNAIKYNGKPDPLVEIGYLESLKTQHGEEKSVFYVKDNGIGIDQRYHQEIFRIFRRVTASSEEKEQGTGVGLTFVKKIVERHNGRIWLESAPGQGSTFYFTLGRKGHA